MVSHELLKEIQKVESKYKSVINAPDNVMEPILEIASSLHDQNRSALGKNTTMRSEAIREALSKVNTSTMTADEITSYLNTDIDVTKDGALVMDKHSVYSLLYAHKIPYKHKSKREYNPQILRGKKE